MCGAGTPTGHGRTASAWLRRLLVTVLALVTSLAVGVPSASSSGAVALPVYGYDNSLELSGRPLSGPVPYGSAARPELARATGERAPWPPATTTGVAAEGGSRVFWSGGQAAKNAAADYALANGSKTLEMTAVGRALERIPRGPIADRISKPLWDLASAGFAATARGEAHVFIGSEFRGRASVFGRIEGPILNLKGNPILQHFGDVF